MAMNRALQRRRFQSGAALSPSPMGYAAGSPLFLILQKYFSGLSQSTSNARSRLPPHKAVKTFPPEPFAEGAA